MRTTIVSVLSAVALVGGLGIATADVSPEVSDPSPVVEVEKTAPPTPPVTVPDTVVEVDQTEVEVIPAPEPVMEPEPEVMEPDPLPEPCPEKEALAEDGSCVPLDYWDTPAFREPSTNVGSWWDGLLVGDVIVCPPGYEVSIDVTPAGTVWAACM